MKTNRHRYSLCAAALLTLMDLPAWCADIDHFLNPAGAAWGRVLFTNSVSSRALAIERCHEGFVVAGMAQVGTNHWMWIVKVDRRGRPVWEKFYDGPYEAGEYARGLVRGTDGGYALAGHLGSFPTLPDAFPRFPRLVLIEQPDLMVLAGIVLAISVLASLLDIWKAMSVEPNKILAA